MENPQTEEKVQEKDNLRRFKYYNIFFGVAVISMLVDIYLYSMVGEGYNHFLVFFVAKEFFALNTFVMYAMHIVLLPFFVGGPIDVIRIILKKA